MCGWIGMITTQLLLAYETKTFLLLPSKFNSDVRIRVSTQLEALYTVLHVGVNPETAVSPVKYSTNRNQRGPLVFTCLLDFGKWQHL